MHAANPKRSVRLKKVLRFLRLRGGAGATTMDIIMKCRVCAVNAIVSELRQARYIIPCVQTGSGDTRVARYTLKRGRSA